MVFESPVVNDLLRGIIFELLQEFVKSGCPAKRFAYGKMKNHKITQGAGFTVFCNRWSKKTKTNLTF